LPARRELSLVSDDYQGQLLIDCLQLSGVVVGVPWPSVFFTNDKEATRLAVGEEHQRWRRGTPTVAALERDR